MFRIINQLYHWTSIHTLQGSTDYLQLQRVSELYQYVSMNHSFDLKQPTINGDVAFSVLLMLPY
jgi:hypothetical protein